MTAPMTAPMPFRPTSVQFNSTLSKELRKEQGIFFTPKTLRDRLFHILSLYMPNPENMLEPSFGSGEFIHDIVERFPNISIFGVEKNKEMYDALATATADKSNIVLRNTDFLDFPHFMFDAIVGNPPYFVTDAKNPACMVGRGNIFVQFIYKCLTQHLVKGGVLAFIIPTSFYNCSYYQPCRDYITQKTTIVHLENLAGGFYDTAQDTTLIVIRNTPPPNPATPAYTFTLHGSQYLSPNYKELAEGTKTATTLSALGLAVKTGDVVWNQVKPDLHDTQGTPVIYMSNIVNNTLVLNNFSQANKKKQRIKTYKRTPVKGPAIVVARGYGNSHYKLSYAFIPETNEPFYGENHVNVITATTPEGKNNFQRVLASFANPLTSRFLAMFIGNNALSKTELESVLPIF